MAAAILVKSASIDSMKDSAMIEIVSGSALCRAWA
jgi:hypothetical protein